MKIFLIFLFLISSSFSSNLNAVGDSQIIPEIQEYNSSDYDPGIPLEWIKEDGTFGE